MGTVLLVLLFLLVVLFSGCLFVLILIWRAIMGRTLVNSKLASQVGIFSNRIAQYTSEFGKLDTTVKSLNRDVDVLSRDLAGLPEKLQFVLEKYAKGDNKS